MLLMDDVAVLSNIHVSGVGSLYVAVYVYMSTGLLFMAQLSAS